MESEYSPSMVFSPEQPSPPASVAPTHSRPRSSGRPYPAAISSYVTGRDDFGPRNRVLASGRPLFAGSSAVAEGKHIRSRYVSPVPLSAPAFLVPGSGATARRLSNAVRPVPMPERNVPSGRFKYSPPTAIGQPVTEKPRLDDFEQMTPHAPASYLPDAVQDDLFEISHKVGTADSFSDKDVLFIFGKEGRDGKQTLLWAKRAQLQEASPYWKTLFESGYKEGEDKLQSLSKWKKMLASDVASIMDDFQSSRNAADSSTFEDSDAEDDSEVDPSEGKAKHAAGQTDSSEEDTAIRYVVVNDATSKTYRAVLQWIESETIYFSTLTSVVPKDIARQPATASPKSVYALAHKLGITALQNLALEQFSKQLYSHNVLKELFSTHAALYPEIAEAAMKAAIEYMPAIKSSGEHTYISDVMNAGDLDHDYVVRTVTDLFGRT